MNIGLFGGTFDPPHTGHLIVAQDAALALGLDRILFVPAAQPPHKHAAAVSDPALRAGMLRLAIERDSRFGLEPVELERRGPSYTVETLRELREREPAVQWTLFMGADQYAEFDTWREPAAIRQLARIAVLTRLGSGSAARSGKAAATPLGDGAVEVDVTRIDISSTMIRERVAAGRPIRYLVPAPVEAFIFEHGLYGRNGRAAAG